jgi:CheY-like chemotaxis protein
MDIELLKNLNVLYVEDEKEVANELVHNLKFFVNNIIFCENGQEGLNKFIEKQNEINIIITDVLMPVLDGKDMVDKIRLTSQSIPIIYTTAFNNAEFIEYIKGQNLIDHIAKPIDLEELFVLIIKLMNK